MNTKSRQRYTAEFKAQAVELISTGKPVSKIAEELCISSNLLYIWKQDSQGGSEDNSLGDKVYDAMADSELTAIII